MICDERNAVIRDVAGCCPYCHQRTKGTWKIPVELSVLWPQTVSCPQCHQKWDSIAHFNQDAKRITLAVMRESPERIAMLNETAEDRDWASFMDDSIELHKDRQNWETRRRTGKDWEPWLHPPEGQRIFTEIGGGSGGEAETPAGQDDQEGSPAEPEVGADTDGHSTGLRDADSD